MTVKRLVIGISGATGFAYGIKALELLKPLDIETHLVISKAAQLRQHKQRKSTKAQQQATGLAQTV